MSRDVNLAPPSQQHGKSQLKTRFHVSGDVFSRAVHVRMIFGAIDS